MKITVMKNEADFQRIHKEYGGSSYSAALFDHGYADMPSAWSIWAMFSGKLEDVGPDEEANARVRIGKAIEPVIAQEAAFKEGWDLLEGVEYHDTPEPHEAGLQWGDRIYVHHPDPALKMGCTVDRYIREHEDGPGIIECKNRDFIQWIENYTDDDASIKDQIQLAHQFACHPEIKWGAIAALVGGNDLKIYKYKRADLQDMMDDIESRWRWLWGKVEGQEEPPITGSELPAWLKAHDEALGSYGNEQLSINDDKVGDDLTFDEIAAEYLQSAERRKHYDKIEKKRKAQIVQHLDEHTWARSNQFKVKATYSKVKGNYITTAEVEAKGGTFEIRKPHIRVSLKFDDDPMTDQGHPTEAQVRQGMQAQAPIE